MSGEKKAVADAELNEVFTELQIRELFECSLRESLHWLKISGVDGFECAFEIEKQRRMLRCLVIFEARVKYACALYDFACKEDGWNAGDYAKHDVVARLTKESSGLHGFVVATVNSHAYQELKSESVVNKEVEVRRYAHMVEQMIWDALC